MRADACGLLALLLMPWLAGQQPAVPRERLEFFERRIRPVLAQDCYECHSSSGKQKGGLALDHRAPLLRGGDSGPAIVPGDPAQSLLLTAIRRTDPHLQMPKERAALTTTVVADFTQWIRDGAIDPRDGPPTAAEVAADTDWNAVMQRRLGWWSFQPIRATDLSQLPGDAATPAIDRFLAEQLAQRGLAAAPRAEPGVLLRRLSQALRGLPPTAAELAAFERDPGDAAFVQFVDRWLGASQFGERWARHWMDWLRYADSHGSEGDPMIPYAWRYRDYVIRALDQDVGYDQLLREHLAGDLLPSPRIDPATGSNESTVGPAHLRMVFHGFAPTDPREELVRFTDDQIDVVSKAFLGLTVSCARCHDHKFDPISQQDYTALYGIFTSCSPAVLDATAASPSQPAQRTNLRSAKDQLRRGLAARFHAAADALAQRLVQPDEALQNAIAKASSPDDLLQPFFVLQQAAHNAPFAAWRQPTKADAVAPKVRWDLAQRGDLARWHRSGDGVAEVGAAGSFALAAGGEQALLGIYPAGAYSHLSSTKDRGVLLSPPAQLDLKYDLWLLVAGDGGATARYVVQHYPRDGSVFPITGLDGGHWRWLKFNLDYWTEDPIHVELATAADQPVQARTDVARSWFGLREVQLLPSGSSPPANRREFAAPLLAASGEREPATAAALAEIYAAALRTAAKAWQDGSLDDAQALYLDALLRAGLLPNRLDQLPELAVDITACRALEGTLPAPIRVPGVLDVDPVDAPVFGRGNARQPGVVVLRRSLSAFGGAPSPRDRSGRLELAADLLRADNPLVARVISNRVWHHLFGRGLVATTDNFGHMGQPPSHPALLDHLAIDFRAHGWSIKSLIRQIVTSAAWQRSSEPPPGAQERDPDNVWLSHFAVRRLEAEAIRDGMLAVAGDLEVTQFGPPVLGDSRRRSVYMRQKRNDMDPFLAAFDAPVPASAKGQRDTTNVPAQSLALLNDPFVLQCAEHWALRLAADGSLQDPARRVDAMFVAAFARSPTSTEQERALAYVARSAAAHGAAETRRQEGARALAAANEQLQQLTGLAMERVAAQRQVASPVLESMPSPIAAWAFRTGALDEVGNLHAELRGTARLADAALVLDGTQGYAATVPLTRTLREKTLMAWVQLDDLTQQGGGVISVQHSNGDVFDAIVFGEQAAGHWLAGSDRFARTRSFGGAAETEARDRPVHIAITYAGDGTITAYRNGERHGEPYRSSGPVTFEAGNAQVLFGLRHGAPGGNRLLAGRIQRAALFDRALSAAEVQSVARASGDIVTTAELHAASTPTEREVCRALQASIAAGSKQLQELERASGASTPWADLAHALFNQKEFLYLR